MKEKEIGILVVDDELIVRESLTRWFREEGYRVDSAENAVTTLRKLQEQKWNIILLDIKLPGIEGTELLQWIRQSNENISVIMITAYATIESAVKAIKAGAYDYVTKPVSPEELDKLIGKAIGEQASFIKKPLNRRRKRRLLADVEHDHIEAVLKETDWNVEESAAILGLDQTTLQHKIREHRLKHRGPCGP